MNKHDRQCARLHAIFSEGSFRLELQTAFEQGLQLSLGDPKRPFDAITNDDLRRIIQDTALDATAWVENGEIHLSDE